jgi:uncharacterized protein involved in exopolysaccharide biosynthesis
MEAVKGIIDQYCFAKSLQFDLATVNSKISQTESTIKELPDDQQELIKIKRKYDLSDNIYSTFLQKEVRQILLKQNLSDIHFIDPAKDVEVNRPKTR